MAEDPYVYPDSFVLKNKHGIRDAGHLRILESRLTALRMAQPPADFSVDPAGYRSLHRHIFQDVYPWAGEYRTCQLGKPFWFEEPSKIVGRMEERFGKLNAEDNLRDLDSALFAKRAAEHLCELNDIHPFRDGNGRVNRLFARLLAEQAGHKLDVLSIRRDEWMHASKAGFHRNDFEPMERLLKQTLNIRKHDLGMGI